MTEVPVRIELKTAEDYTKALERKVIEAAREYVSRTRIVISALEGKTSTVVPAEFMQLHHAVLDLESLTRKETHTAIIECEHFKQRVNAFFQHIRLAFRALFSKCAHCQIIEWAHQEAVRIAGDLHG